MGRWTPLFAAGVATIAALLLWPKEQPWPHQRITLGQSCALSGPSAELGEGMMTGANAYFAHINDTGGIHGRSVSLITRDDSYEPKLTEANTRYLIEQERVFALFGYVGTPTTQAALKLIEAHRIPLIAPLTGAGMIRQPPRDLIINIRSSYQDEAREIIRYLDEQNITRVAVFYQNDSYGRSGLAATRKALERYDRQPVAEGSYNRNTLAVGHALYEIAPANPEAVVMVDAYKPSAAFIRRMRHAGLKDTRFFHLSFVNSDALMHELTPKESEGVFVSQVVPPPWQEGRAIVAEYQQIMARYAPEAPLSFASLEGFIAAKVTASALQIAGAKLTREGFLAALEKVQPDQLKGLAFAMRPKAQEGINQLWITTQKGDRMQVIHEGSR
jgi:ABC-type branched-subunit amino acid transport system substrate-binding protein